eukprot:SAG31_NODE_122_length_23797_cov_39.343812_4_plen_41_part_00
MTKRKSYFRVRANSSKLEQTLAYGCMLVVILLVHDLHLVV